MHVIGLTRFSLKNLRSEGSFRFFRCSWISGASFNKFIIWVSQALEISSLRASSACVLAVPDLILFLFAQFGIPRNVHFFRKYPLTNRSGLVRLYVEIIPMYITNITEAKAHFSALIEKVLAGEEIIIAKSGKPVAKLVSFERRKESSQPGALKGKIKIADNFDQLPDDIAEDFGIITD